MKIIEKLTLACLVLACLLSLVSCSNDLNQAALSYGEVEGDTYVNSFLGLQITAPGKWRFLSEEEIAELTGMVKDAYPDVESFESSEAAEKIIMYLTDSSSIGRNSLNITLSKGTALASLKKTIDQTKEQLIDTYEQIGATPSFGEDEKVTLGSKEYTLVTLTAEINGQSFSQYCYFAKYGSYFCVIAATDFTGVGRSTYENMFSSYSE